MDLPLKLKVEEMVKLAMHYVSTVQGRLPSRKTDIIKYAMNKQSKDFPTVIEKVDKELRKICGFQLIGLKNGPNEAPVTCEILEATSFIIVNRFRQRTIALAAPDQTFPTDLVKAVLLLILTCTYMMNQPLEEGAIWKILEEMEFAEHLPLCKRREDFKRFMKIEYVDLLYLTKYEAKDAELTDQVTVSYGWGIRAEVEFSKYAILKFAARSLGKNPEEFVDQFSKISPTEILGINKEEESYRRKGLETAELVDETLQQDETNHQGPSLPVVTQRSGRVADIDLPSTADRSSRNLIGMEKAESSDEDDDDI